MNIRDLSNALHLSTATVSLALSPTKGEGRLSPETAARVRAYAESVGYVPNCYAQKIFRPDRSRPIGLLLKQDSAANRSTPLLQQAMRQLNQSGREYLVQNCDETHIVPAIRQMLGFSVRQIILIGYTDPFMLQGIENYRELELFVLDYVLRPGVPPPVCRCRMWMDRPRFYQTLAQELLRQGFGPLGCDSNSRYYLREFLGENACVIPMPHAASAEYGEEAAPPVIRAVREKRCRTMICRQDMFAIGLMEGVLKAGLRIPEDLMLIGFNAAEMGKYAKVSLSTVRPPAEKHLQMVLEHLLTGKELPDAVESEPEMILRNSTGEFVWKENQKT